MKLRSLTFFLFLALTITGCQNNSAIVTNVDEKEANLIVVFLDSKGIKASKVKIVASSAGGGDAAQMFEIMVSDTQSIQAMAFLNQFGLPKRKGTNLLELFAKQGLMSSDKEETIRYQAGLESQIANTLMMIDGILDVTVQISFPKADPGQDVTETTTAAIYVKHQGILDDANSHIESKIKRLVSGSVTALDINDVTVVSDKARLSNIQLNDSSLSLSAENETLVKIWSIVMTKESVSVFRFLFGTLLILLLLFALSIGFLIWKLYPNIKKKNGIKKLFTIEPFPAANPIETEISDETTL